MIVRLMLALLVLAATARAGAPLEIWRDGRLVTEPPGPALEANLVRLLASCSVESTDYAVKPSTWAELRRSPSRVHLNLVTPTRVHSRSGTLWVTDIVVLLRPDSYPGHVYVRLGDTVRSFTKYQPDVLLAVSRDPSLRLLSSRAYADLERSERTRR